MTVMSDDDTRSAEDFADEPETTVVESDTSTVDARELAWSLDDGDDEPQRQPWRSVWGIVGVIAACSIVIAGVTGVVLWVTRQHNDVQPLSPQPTSTAVAEPTPTGPKYCAPGHNADKGCLPVVNAGPPATVTVTAPTPTTTATPALQGADAKFITFLRGSGPIGFNAVSTTSAIADAHLVCADLQQGTGFQNINDRLQNLSPDDVIWFVNVVPGFYCPQFHND